MGYVQMSAHPYLTEWRESHLTEWRETDMAERVTLEAPELRPCNQVSAVPTSTGVLIAIARAFAEIPEDLAARLHLDRITAPHNPEASISSLMVELLARPSPTCD